MSLELFLLFATATLTFAVMPGPAILYVVACTLSGGRAAGLRATAGVHLGGYLHVLAAMAGLALLLEAVPYLYGALKLLGACYLIWIGVGLLRASFSGAQMHLPPARAISLRQSFLVEALNPKAALFYLAFLPQFTSAEAVLSVPLQLLLLGIIVNLAFSLADIVYVLAADGLHRRFANSRAVLWLRRAGGAILVALGLNLALSRN